MGRTRGKVLLTVEQISFAKLLAGNDKKTRDKGLKKLRKYFTVRSEGMDEFREDDYMRIWKGLFYCMWMSDKSLIQEELAENISSLIHCFKGTKSAILFMGSFFSTMGNEWFGIDQHRLDKFLMLVRRFLRQTLVYCHQRGWDEELVKQITTMFSSTVLSASSGRPSQLGLTLHFTDIFLEELAKVSKGALSQHIMLEFLRPFLQHLSEQDEARFRSHVVRHIFHHLMKQSDMGIEYEEKFTAWKRAGFPGESCEDMERVELDDPSDTDQYIGEENWDTDVKDPRAGRVNVTLPQLQFDAEKVAEIIFEYAKKAPVLKSRKVLYQLADQFSDMARGNYPLAFKLKVPEGLLQKKKKKGKSKKSELWEAAETLMLFEECLKNEELGQRIGKKRKLDEEDGDPEDQVTPVKLKQMTVQLTRCDSSNSNVTCKVRKRKVPNALGKTNGGAVDSGERMDTASDRLATEMALKELSLELPKQKTKIMKRKTFSDGVKPRASVKLKKCVDSLCDNPKSIPLKKLRICLNSWEVTDICNKSNQSLQAFKQSQPMQPLEEKTNSPEKEVPSAIVSPATSSTQIRVKNDSPNRKMTPAKKLLPNGTSGSAKKVNIALQMNKEQNLE